jgi:hypothetical protein
MGIETLNTAARAAGFAMASDEVAPDVSVEAKPETPEGWRPDRAAMLDPEREIASRAEQPSNADWLKSLLGVFGRGAPA